LDHDIGGGENDLARRLVMDKAAFRSGHGVRKGARVGMARRAEDVGRRRLLDQAAARQDRDPVGDARHQCKIVRNIQRGNARLPAQSREQFEDARAVMTSSAVVGSSKRMTSGWQPKAWQ